MNPILQLGDRCRACYRMQALQSEADTAARARHAARIRRGTARTRLARRSRRGLAFAPAGSGH